MCAFLRAAARGFFDRHSLASQGISRVPRASFRLMDFR